MKIIKVDDETHKRLQGIGVKAETFNDLINRILDERESSK